MSDLPLFLLLSFLDSVRLSRAVFATKYVFPEHANRVAYLPPPNDGPILPEEIERCRKAQRKTILRFCVCTVVRIASDRSDDIDWLMMVVDKQGHVCQIFHFSDIHIGDVAIWQVTHLCAISHFYERKIKETESYFLFHFIFLYILLHCLNITTICSPAVYFYCI